MINSIPILGWCLSVIINISLAIPFWACWSWYGIGEVYFYFLPEVYLNPSFFDCVFFFIVVSILKGLVPTLSSNTQKVNND